jgi:ABC-type transport system substrate-binding protein
MNRRLWLLAGAVAAVLVLAASATATSSGSSRVSGGTPAAAPFAQAWAKVPTTTAGRKAKNIVVFGAEQDINGFNTSLNCCSQLWANFMGLVETDHGAFNVNQKGQFFPEKYIVSSATATKTGLSYTIAPNANWYWGGKKVPITYKDFVYTLQQVDNPNNDLTSRTGYSNLDPTHYTHKGLKQVTLFWKTKNCSTDFPCGPFALWQSLFGGAGGLYPAQALVGSKFDCNTSCPVDFNKIWTTCICGTDGQPVSNGPYYLSNYTKGQGTTLKANPFWGGAKPKVAEIDFKLITDTNTEEEAMRGGEVDAITPTFGLYLAPLKSTPGLNYSQIPGAYYEHLEFREGSAPAGPSVSKGATNKLLRAPWMRQAIALGIDRQSIINTIYGDLGKGVIPLNNMEYFQTQAEYKPDFKKWNYNPTSALKILAKHCSGGPNAPSPSNSSIWQCSGLPAAFNWTWTASNSVRTTSEAIVTAELKSIGIQITAKPLAANVIFGANGVPSGDFDIAEFAQIPTGVADPSVWYDSYRCGGNGNYTGFCSHTVDNLMKAGNGELNPAKRAADFQKADVVLSGLVPMLPMYQRPTPLIHKSDLLGMVNAPSGPGVFWNIEAWHWK